MSNANELGVRMRGRLMRRLPAVAAAAAVLFAGVSLDLGSQAGASTPKSKAPSTVHVGLAGSFNTAYTAFLIADTPKYYGTVEKKFRTKIVYDIYSNTNSLIAAYQGGQEQMIVLPPITLIASNQAGMDMVNLEAVSSGIGVVAIGANKYKTSRGRNIKAYNGGNWCNLTPSGTLYDVEVGLATSAGLKWSNQHAVSTGSLAAMIPGLQSGQCDITAMDPSTAANTIVNNVGYLVANPNVPPYAEEVFGSNVPQVGDGLITSSKFIASYPALTQAMVTQQTKALLFVQANKGNSNVLYAAMPNQLYRSKNSLGLFAQAWTLSAPNYVLASGLVTKPRMAATVSFAVRTGSLQAGSYKGTKWFPNKFVYASYKALGLPKPPASGAPLPQSASATTTG